jgi:hypothetical protein
LSGKRICAVIATVAAIITIFAFVTGSLSLQDLIGHSSKSEQPSDTLHATDEPDSVTITYDTNGAPTSVQAPTSITVQRDTLVEMPIPTPQTYWDSTQNRSLKFIGWAFFSNGNVTYFKPGVNYTANSDVALFAVWEPEEWVTITYNTNGAPTSVQAPPPITVQRNSPMELPIPTPQTYWDSDLNRRFHFVRWAFFSDDDVKYYGLGVKYTAVTDVTLYAVWKPQE